MKIKHLAGQNGVKSCNNLSAGELRLCLEEQAAEDLSGQNEIFAWKR